MDEQQKQQEQQDGPGNSTQNQLTDAEVAEQQKAKDAAAAQEAATQQQAGAVEGKTAPAQHVGLLGRIGHGIEHASGAEAIERHERRRQAFSAAKAGPVGAAINDVNAFLHAMQDGDFDTPEEMLADTDIQNAAKRAREGLKVFTGDTPVTFSKPTSDAHLNTGSGGAVTGNTSANKQKAAAVLDEHDDGEDAAPGVAKVPQPDAAVR
jgi:hypothetical protein